MKFSYKFSNLLGTIYRKGNLCFTPDGNSIISPVGNRLTIFDLKNNKAKTLSVESRYNYNTIALSPNGSLLIAVNENGEAQMISLVSCTLIHRHKFQTAVQCVQFSPDGKHFAVGRENHVFVFKSPGEITGEYNPFVLERHFIGGYDDITWLEWSTDSRFLAIGCRDNSTRICAIKFLTNFRTVILGGHTEPIVGAFFEEGNLHLNTISRNGQLCLWECSLNYSDITDFKSSNPLEPPLNKRKKNEENDSEDDIDNTNVEQKDSVETTNANDPNEEKPDEKKKQHPFFYKKVARYYLADEPRKENSKAYLTSASYNRKTKVLVVTFSTGSFYLYELPDVNMIHSLTISDYPITSAVFNPSGDWVALASAGLGQLLVWEWQSEQYIMKQQGHTSEMGCITYSPDGQYIATGGTDSKVKLWNSYNGFCFVTFNEHTSTVTGIQFSNNKKFLVSCSLDGTVRAYDIIRYRNFRTFTTPQPVQFSCVAVDYSGELVCAGGQDVFEIYLWSIKLGKLLEILSGHEGPVASLAFSPVSTSSTLVSGSWDRTIRIWNCLEDNSETETIDVMSDVTCVAFKPNGEEVAVSTLNGNISIFCVKTSTQISSIEGRNDLGSGRSEIDIITAKKNLQGKSFNSIVYSADGECLLAAGKSQFVCIYHVRDGILLKKFEITQNHSFDGLDEYINRRKITEFGNMALVEERERQEGGNVAIGLPGVQKGDMATRNFKPEVNVFSVKFSPTGQSWIAACTEGLLIYSLNKDVVFDPFDLSIEVTPKAARDSLRNKEYANAITMAVKLNEPDLIQSIIENIPYKEVTLVSATLSTEISQRLLQHISQLIQQTPHVEYYLNWSSCLLTDNGNKGGGFQHHTLLTLQESLSRKYEMLHKMCDFNKYTLKVLSNLKVNEANGTNGADGASSSDNDDADMVLISTNNNFDVNDSESDFNENKSESD